MKPKIVIGKINKINKPLSNWSREKEKEKIANIRNEKETSLQIL